MEISSKVQVPCPVCGRRMEPVGRQSTWVLMLCPGCRISVTIHPSTMDQQPCQSLNFPMACPECANTAGIPYRASTTLQQDGIVLFLRCKACGHEWECTVPAGSQDATLRPRPDRRMG